MTEIKLKEMNNHANIVGTLKTKQKFEGTDKNGNAYITGNLTIRVNDGEHNNDIRVNLYAKESMSFYKSLTKVFNEYKALDDIARDVDGNPLEQATRMMVATQYDIRDAMSQDLEKEYLNTQLRSKFTITRDGLDNIPDEAYLTMDTVIESFTPIEVDGQPTGKYNVNGFTVGYNSRVIPLKNFVVGGDLANSFMGLYQNNSTGSITYQIKSYADTTEVKLEKPVAAHGFGSTKKVEEVKVFDKTVEEFIAIGGDVPFYDEQKLTDDEIKEAKRLRKLQKESALDYYIKKNRGQNAQKNDNGFGTKKHTGFGQQDKLNDLGTPEEFEVKNDDLPFY